VRCAPRLSAVHDELAALFQYRCVQGSAHRLRRCGGDLRGVPSLRVQYVPYLGEHRAVMYCGCVRMPILCVCVSAGQPIKLYVEQERAERKLQERAIKEATARYAGTVPMSEDQPPSKELRRIQRAAAQRASVEFHRFNSPRFCREYKRDVQMLICITMYNVSCDRQCTDVRKL